MELNDFVVKYWYLFAALLAILALLVGGEAMRRIRGVPALTPTQALQLINHADAVIVDVRDSGEFRSGHIANARNIPLAELQNRITELEKYKDRPLLVYCNTGPRAGSACVQLKKSGFTNVSSLQGGLPAWTGASLPISRK